MLRCLLVIAILAIVRPSLTYAEPRITELMAAGQAAVADEDHAFPDWVEIHNPDLVPANLGGWHLMDSAGKLRKWTFPAVVLPPGGYVVVFASAKDRRPANGVLHTDFRLDGVGGTLLLTRPDAAVAQTISYPAQLPDVSWDGVKFLAKPTPGAANDLAEEPITQAPEFSQPRGFQAAAFTLAMTSGTPGAVIYFTLDGSEPNLASTLYVAPIRISKTTAVRAVAISPGNDASPLTARTFLFPSDIVKQSANGAAPKGWPASWGQNHVDYGMDPDITRKAPFSRTLKDDLRAVPSFSVVMDLNDLFDAGSGFYANPFNKGREWERPMSLEYIEPTGGGGFQIHGGIRVRGGASRDTGNAKHSLQFRFRKEYGATHLDYPLFGESGPTRTDAFDLRWDHLVSWHYSNTPEANQLQDIFGRDSQLAMNGVAKRGDLCNLYFNGQYWGLFFIDERVNGDFGANHFGGSAADYDVIRYDAESGATGLNEGTRRVWRAAFDLGFAGFEDDARYFRALGRNPDGSRNPGYERLIDEENLIDYMLVGSWCGATDNPFSGGTDNNWTSIRSRKGDFGFRFFVHDFELSMYGVDDNFIGAAPFDNVLRERDADTINPWHFWMAMRMNAEFRMKVADRVQKHFFNGGALTAEACVARWNARMQEMDRAIVAESARWGDGVGGGGIWGPIEQKIVGPGGETEDGGHRAYTRTDWLAGATSVRDTYVALRSELMLQHLKDGGLYPGTPAPAFDTTGSAVMLTNPNGTGAIYYTLNGPDPRLVGGEVSPDALTLSGAIQPARKTTVKARVLDGANWSALVEFEFAPDVDFSELRVTEIHYNPLVARAATADDAEFLELKNTGATPLDLSGCMFSEGITFTFPAGTVIQPGAFFVVARNATVFSQKYPGRLPDGIFAGKLGDDGESLVLTAATGARIFALEYDDESPWPLAPDGFGASLVYDGTGNPDDGKNWRASAQVGGSPGADDPAPSYLPKLVVNEVRAGEFVELHNPSAASADISGWRLGTDRALPPAKVFDVGTVIPAGGFLLVTAAAGMPTLDTAGGSVFIDSEPSGYAHQCRYGPLENGVAFGRHINADGEEKFVAVVPTPGSANATPLERGPLRIAEIFYASAGLDFVELENTSASAVWLDGMRLAGMNYTFPAGVVLAGGERVVVTAASEPTFRIAFPSASIVLGPTPGNLQDDGERVALEEPFGGSWRVLDEVRYNDRYPWPAGAAGAGDSLHRLPVSYADESGAWTVGAPSPSGKGVDGRPSVAVTSPSDGFVTVAGSLLTLTASAADIDGAVEKVEFFIDGRAIGATTVAPYSTEWVAAPGTHDIGARAYDLAGNFSDAKPVAVFAGGSGGLRDSGEGLKAEYFPNSTLTGTPVETTVEQLAFDWSELSPAVGIPHAGFSARFSGKLLPRRTGNHTLIFRHAGGMRVMLNGSVFLESWMEPALSDGGFAYSEANFEFVAGVPVDIVVEYFDENAHGFLSFAWYEPGEFNENLVPQSQLYLPPQDVAAFGISTPSRIPARRLGQKVRVALDTLRGTAPVLWRQVSGLLPAGVALNPSGTLAGVATEGGDFTFRLEAEDAEGEIVARTFSLHIVRAETGGFGPVVRFTKPSANASVTASPLLVSGTVRGAAPLVSLAYSVNDSAFHPMVPSTHWSIALDKLRGLAPGGNTVRVLATDDEGREAAAQVRFTYRLRSPLDVSLSGAGTVTAGFLGTTHRYVGDEFTIRAKAAPGWVFSHWEPGFESTPRVKFTMSENMTLKAVFVPNPFGPFTGNYVGLVGEGGKMSRYQFSVSKTGAFSFALVSGKERLSVAGVLSASGYFSFYQEPKNGLPNSLELSLGLDAGTAVITTQYYGSDFFDVFESTAKRADWLTDCPAAGRWALTLPSPGPVLLGNGFAAMRIGRDGRVKLSGRAADGARLSSGLRVANDLSLPFSSPLAVDGGIVGTLTYSSQPGRRILGDLNWVSAALSTTLSANASPYTVPRDGTAAIPLTSGVARFTDSISDQSFTTPARLNSLNHFVFSAPGATRPSMLLDPKTGIIRGSYLNPETGQRIGVRGIVDQLTNSASGVILSEVRGGFTISIP